MRKNTCAPCPLIAMSGVSRRLSLTVAGSSTKASLGGVSGAVVEVTHSGAAPAALAADHPVGNAGAVTPSKFSPKTEASAQGVIAGVGLVVAVAVAVGLGVEVAVGVAVMVGVGVGPAVHSGNLKLPMRVRQLPALVVA